MNEGGAFVKFRHGHNEDAQSIADTIRQHVEWKAVRPWWKPWSTVKVSLVLGRPWLEDLFRMPSRRLRVEFLSPQPGKEAAELNQEQLYTFFRPFGKLVEITRQPSDSKVTPKYAHIDFATSHRSIMAKNCLHGFVVGEDEGGGSAGIILRITYEKQKNFGWIKDWMLSHPRIVIPLLAALVAGISIVVF